MPDRVFKVVLIGAALLAAAPPLMGADATNGAQLARQWCANCHLIGAVAPGSVQQGPPSFIAIEHDLTPDQLHTFLSHPHPPMPDLALTRLEIDDLIAFIGILRSELIGNK